MLSAIVHRYAGWFAEFLNHFVFLHADPNGVHFGSRSETTGDQGEQQQEYDEAHGFRFYAAVVGNASNFLELLDAAVNGRASMSCRVQHTQ